MKKYTLLFVLLAGVILSLKAQDCEISINDAKNYYQKNEYEKALLIIADIEKDCPSYFIEVKDIKQICEREVNKKNSSLTVNKTKIEFTSMGGIEKVTVNHKNCTWTHSNNPKWLTLKSTENQLSIVCDKNTSSKKREAYITITSDTDLTKKIHVIQEPDALSVSNEYLSFQADGGTTTIFVTSNSNWAVDSQSDYWFNAKKQGNKLTITCNHNRTSNKRTGKLTIVSDSGSSVVITIAQAGEDAYLSLTERLHYGSKGGSNIITVNSNVYWYVGSSSETWCKATKKGEHELVIEVRPNDNKYSRSAFVKIRANDKYKDIYITQDKRGFFNGIIQWFKDLKDRIF